MNNAARKDLEDWQPLGVVLTDITIVHDQGERRTYRGYVDHHAKTPEKDKIVVRWPLYGIMTFHRRGKAVLKAHLRWSVCKEDVERLKRLTPIELAARDTNKGDQP